MLSEPKLVVPCSDLPTYVTHIATDETSQPAESIVPQKRIRDTIIPELNDDPPAQGFGSSQKKKRKKNQKGEKTII